MRRRLKALLLVAVLILSLLPAQTKKADASSWMSIPAGKYYICNDANGRYLNVCDAGNWNNCNVDTWYFNGCGAQVWTISGNVNSYKIQPGCSSTRVLNQWGNSVVSGHNVCLWDNTNDPTQRWVFQKQYGNRFIIRCAGNTNCVLDVDQNGNVFVNNYVAGRRSQWWYLTEAEAVVPAGSYYFASFCDGRYLDVQSGGDYNTCNVGLYGFNGSNAQTWVINGSSTWYRIKPKCTVNRVLNQYGDYAAPGHNVNLWDDTYDGTQRWTFEKVKWAYGNMTLYVVHLAANPSCVLDVDAYGNVFVNTYGGQYDESQLWVLQSAQ